MKAMVFGRRPGLAGAGWRRTVGLLLAALLPLYASDASAHATCAHHAPAVPVPAAAERPAQPEADHRHGHHGSTLAAAPQASDSHDTHDSTAPCTCIGACCPAAAVALAAAGTATLPLAIDDERSAPGPGASSPAIAGADHRQPPATAPPLVPVSQHC